MTAVRQDLTDPVDSGAPAVPYADDLTFLRGHYDPLLTFAECTAIKVQPARRIALR